MTVHVHTIIIKHTVCSFQIQNKCKWYACYIIQQKYTCTKCINWPTWTDVLQWKLFPLMETCPGHSMNTSFCHIKISSFNLSEISQIFSYFALKSTEREVPVAMFITIVVSPPPAVTPGVDFTKSCKSKINRKCDFQAFDWLKFTLTTDLRLTTFCEIDHWCLKLILYFCMFITFWTFVHKSSHFVSAFFWNHMMILYCENVCMI
jgi:hypothetical protein